MLIVAENFDIVVSDLGAKKFARYIRALFVTEIIVSGTHCTFHAFQGGTPTGYFSKLSPNTAWKWKDLDRDRSPLNPPLRVRTLAFNRNQLRIRTRTACSEQLVVFAVHMTRTLTCVRQQWGLRAANRLVSEAGTSFAYRDK